MATGAIGLPPPPPGFTEDVAPASAIPPPPAGFTEDVPTDAAQAQGARDTAAHRMPRPGRDVPQYERNAPTTGWQDVGDAVKRVASNANDQLAVIPRAVDAATNMVNYPAALLTGSQQPAQHGVEDLYKKYFGTEAANVKPGTSWGDQMLDAGGKMLGENLPVMVGVGTLAAGMRAAEGAAPTLVNAAKNAWNRYADVLVSKPAAMLTGETAAGIESGVLGETSRQHEADAGRGPMAQRLAETSGQIFGPTIMNFAPAMLAKSTIGHAVPYLKTGAQKAVGAVAEALPEEYVPSALKRYGETAQRERVAGANATVNKELSSVMAKPEAKAGLAEAQQLEQDIPGFKPGLARATNDPVLLNTQRKLDSEATGNDLRQSQEAHDQNASSLRSKFESLAPKVENPQDVIHGAEAARVQGEQTKLKSEQGLVGIEQDATNRKLKSAAEALPDAERADAGARFRQVHGEAEQASSDKTTELRKAIAAPDTEVIMKPGKPAVTDEYLPSVPISPEVPPETMTVKQLLDKRASVNQQTREYASATARSVEDIRAMNRLADERQKVDAKINEINLPGMEEYRSYYRDEHVPKFEEGAGRDVGRYDRFGYDKNKVPDEKVLDKFGGPNNISAAKQFTATHGDNPEMVQLMADHQLGQLKKEAVDPATGQMREGAVDKFLTKNKEMLDALPPGVREAVATKNPKELHAKLGELEQRQRALADTKIASNLGATPEKTLDGALNDWQVMRDLKQTVKGNPQHEAALTRAVMDRAPDPTDAKKFGAWLEGHDRVLRQVLTPEHLNDLKTIAKAAEMHARLPRPSGAVELPKSLGGEVGAKTGVTIPSAIGSMLSVARGRTSPFTEAPMQGLKLANRLNDRAVSAAWREALSNPDMAKTLGTITRGKQATPMQINKMHTYLLAAGLIPSNAEHEQK